MTFEPEAYIDLASTLIKLPIVPAHRAAVEQAFAGLMEHAQIVLNEPLGAHDEAAEVFTP